MSESAELNIFTSQLELVETSDTVQPGITSSRAIIRIPVINHGPNNKHLVWTEETMKKIAPMFRGVPFRYDLGGQNEGSHTKDRLSSPFYDVGWTYKGDRGAYYDSEKKAIYVEGEVTHPEVIAKLQRMTSDGRREINFASMGAFIDPKDTKCSVCNRSPFGTCEHQRGESYNGKVCGMVPTDIKKALHVALTNDPADKSAEIEQAIFQDMTNQSELQDNQIDSKASDSPVPVSSAGSTPKDLQDNDQELVELIKKLIREYVGGQNNNEVEVAEMEVDKKKKEKKEEVAEEPKEDSVKEVKEKDVEEKDVEEKDEKKKKKKQSEEENPKVVAQDDSEEVEEEVVEEPKEESVPEEVKSEEETPKVVTQDDSEEEEEEVEEEEELADDSAFKIKGQAQRPKEQVMETASNEVPAPNYADKYKNKLLAELADNFVSVGKATSRDDAIKTLGQKSIEELEIYQDALSGIHIAPTKQKVVQEFHDNHAKGNFADAVPEFGGTVRQDPFVEVSDMSAHERDQSFGTFGKFDVCFNPHNAPKYKK
jgi:hypothetical protein